MAELTNPTNGRSGGRRFRQLPKVDLTAMVDLAFLLITFFMLTTTLAKSNAMDLAMSVDSEAMPVSEDRTMTICLGKNDKLQWYMGTVEHPKVSPGVLDYSRTEIGKILTGQSENVKTQTGESMIVLIKPSDKSSYKNLVDIIDEVTIAGVASYAIVDITEKEVGMMKGNGIY